MQKIDLKKDLKALYSPSAKTVSMVEVPPMRFLMVDGAGDPNTSVAFQQAMEVLFSVSYTLKFLLREVLDIDYGVMPPEGLWWSEDMSRFDASAKDCWLWTLMIMQPDFVTAEHVEQAKAKAAGKKELPALAQLRFETYDEGPSAQILYIGPYAEEGPTVEKIHHFIADSGYTLRGKHHEIYLSDIRRAAPEKWKTVVRQPMGAKS